jgi:opacity protein-like surface antigen
MWKKVASSVFLGLLGTVSAMDGEVTASATKDVVEGATLEEHSAFRGFYGGLGFSINNMGTKNHFHWSGDAVPELESDHRSSNPGGFALLGFGWKMRSNGLYTGIEVGVDLAPAFSYADIDKMYATGTNNSFYSIRTRISGIIPSGALRIGYVDQDSKILTYLKGGVSYIKATETFINETNNAATKSTHQYSTSGVSPFVGIGIEKAFARRATARLEGVFTLGKKGERNYPDGKEILTRKDGVTLRAIVCFHLKIGS